MRTWLVGVLLSVAYSSTAFAATVYDDFNLQQWTVLREGKGPAVHEANQRLELLLSADSTPATGLDRFRGGYKAQCRLQGNFDIQVGYRLINFPPANGVRVGLVFGENGELFEVGRISFSALEGHAEEAYLTHGQSIIWTPTADRKGQLRAVRENGLISGYYFDTTANGWQFIGSSPITTDNMRFLLAIWSHDWAFERKAIKVAFDNVVVNAGTLVGPECPFVSSTAAPEL